MATDVSATPAATPEPVGADLIASLDAPRSRAPRVRDKRKPNARGNFELYAWLFMRVSGLLLVVLTLGHLFIQMVLDGGVQKINFAFVAGRWSSPFWQTWDLSMLWLAELHGTLGLRTIINDYAERNTTRAWLKGLLYFSAVFTLALGTLVIFTFDPNL